MTLACNIADSADQQAELTDRGITNPAFGILPATDPELPLPSTRNWTQIAGYLVSALILVAVVWQMRTLRLAELRALFPTGFAFWSVFVCYYMAGPASDWIIFRRLWSIPVSGMAALLRKLVSNELLFGYLGEVYFYTWARRNAHIVEAPFGAIRDVSILSALVGNATTLAMMLAAAPLIGRLDLGIGAPTFVLSTVVLCLPSLGIFVFRKKLFVLPRADLRFVVVAHTVRTLATTLLAAVMWHLLLPAVPVRSWIVLGTLRLIVSRLPFITNKDLVFAGITVFVVGKEGGIASAMALMATLILVAHLCVGAVLGAAELARAARAR